MLASTPKYQQPRSLSVSASTAGTNRLVVPPVRLATVGSRAFPVAAAHTWNSLPRHIRYDTRCYINVRSKANMSQLNLGYRTEPTTEKCKNRKTKSRKQICSEITVNSPGNIVSASTLQSYKRHLKTFLLQQSFRLALYSGPRSDLDYLGHYKKTLID